MKATVWHITMVLVLLAGILAGCGGDATPSTDGVTEEVSAVSAESGGSDAYASAVLDASYENALPAGSQLAMGTFLLEGTEEAVMPEQARALLPLWQTIQSGALQSDAETNAVLNQIEVALTAEQLAAIAAMQLTFEDMGTWAQEQGLSLSLGPTGGPGDGERGFALPEGMSQEDLEAMRAERQAGGEGGSGPPEGMSQEEIEAMRAAAQASGMARPGGAGGMGAGQLAALAGPLVELLHQTAAG